MLTLSDDGEKIKMDETITYDQDAVLNDYRQMLMAKTASERFTKETPNAIRNIEANIIFSDEIIRVMTEKSNSLKTIFENLGINVQKRCEKIREKYSEEAIVNKTAKIVGESKTEITPVGDKFLITTQTTNDTEDLLLEFMNLNARIPEQIEERAKQEKNLENLKIRLENSLKTAEKINERMKTIEEAFSNRGKDINKLLDDQATNRKHGNKVAEKLPGENGIVSM